MRSATSCGAFGRPTGIPPSARISSSRAVAKSVPAAAARRSIMRFAESVSVEPGETRKTRTPFGPTSLDRRDVDHDAVALLDHRGQERPVQPDGGEEVEAELAVPLRIVEGGEPAA